MNIKENYKIEYLKNNPRMNRVELNKIVDNNLISPSKMERYLILKLYLKMKLQGLKPKDIDEWLSSQFNKSITRIHTIIYNKDDGNTKDI